MNSIYKSLEKIEDQEKNRLTKTQPAQITVEEDDIQQIAKTCLFDLNAQIDVQYLPFHNNKIDSKQCSLSQWQLQKKISKLDINSKSPQKKNIVKRNSLGNKDSLSLFEKSLIEPSLKLCCDKQRSNQTQFIKQKAKNIRINTQSFISQNKAQEESQSNIKYRLKKIPRKYILARQAHLNKRKTQRSQQQIKSCQESSTERIFAPQWLPRLQRKNNQSQIYRNKYRDAFRPGNLLKYSVPMYSPLSRQLIKINDLICQQNRHKISKK